MKRCILEKRQCLTLKELAVNGSDLIAMGLKPGPKMGQVLKELLEVVLEEPGQNQKDILLSKAAEILSF